MTELKTLKDIFLYNHSHSEDGTPMIENSEDFEEILKQEAIKWVKHVKKKFPNHYEYMQPFIEFFNLTKEDLK